MALRCATSGTENESVRRFQYRLGAAQGEVVPGKHVDLCAPCSERYLSRIDPKNMEQAAFAKTLRKRLGIPTLWDGTNEYVPKPSWT